MRTLQTSLLAALIAANLAFPGAVPMPGLWHDDYQVSDQAVRSGQLSLLYNPNSMATRPYQPNKNIPITLVPSETLFADPVFTTTLVGDNLNAAFTVDIPAIEGQPFTASYHLATEYGQPILGFTGEATLDDCFLLSTHPDGPDPMLLRTGKADVTLTLTGQLRWETDLDHPTRDQIPLGSLYVNLQQIRTGPGYLQADSGCLNQETKK